MREINHNFTAGVVSKVTNEFHNPNYINSGAIYAELRYFVLFSGFFTEHAQNQP
jgi:hypothetical protein